MLFFVEGEWTLELSSVPWQIDVARYLAPFAAFFSIVLVLAETAQVTLSNFFVRFYSSHMIVAGLGERSRQFLQTCQDKDRIIVIERNPENLYVNQVRDSGIRVIVGDIFDNQMFQRINLLQASALLAFTGDDGSNVELAIKARNHVKDLADNLRHLRIHIHLDDIGLAHQLESYPKFFADYPNTEVSFFSVYDLSARELLEEYPPEIFADVAAQPRVHFAIYGFKRLAETLMIEAAQLCQYANGTKLRFTIFDEDAKNKEIKLLSVNPYLAKICDFKFIQQSSFGPHVFSGEIAEILPSITQHIVCKDTDEENLNIALMLRTALLEQKSSNAPIMVRMQQSSGLAQLLESNTGLPLAGPTSSHSIYTECRGD